MTEAEHLHAAQVAAREHVVPHIKAAAAEAMRAGNHDAATFHLFMAAVVAGDLDPQIVRYAHALIRFVEAGVPMVGRDRVLGSFARCPDEVDDVCNAAMRGREDR